MVRNRFTTEDVVFLLRLAAAALFAAAALVAFGVIGGNWSGLIASGLGCWAVASLFT